MNLTQDEFARAMQPGLLELVEKCYRAGFEAGVASTLNSKPATEAHTGAGGDAVTHVIDCPKDCDACRIETDLNEALAALRSIVDPATPYSAEKFQAAKAILAKHGDVR